MPSLPDLPSLTSLPPMTYEWPILLWSLALIPVLLLLYVLAQRRRRAYAMRFTNLALLREVAGRRPGLRRHIPPLFFLLGIGALLFSLARPSAVIAVPRDQADVILVVDTSGSMTATDLKPSRMVAARLAAEKFVQALPPNTRVGLVEFSTRARLATPLTRDRAVVLTAIKSLDADGGTAIGDGLALALDVFRREAAGAQSTTTPGSSSPGTAPSTSEETPGTVVLLSDGASSSGQPPQQAATRANQSNVVVHTVGIGERMSGARVGARVPAELDERTLQEIARTTGGEYFYAAQAGDLERIYTSIGSRVSWSEERTEVTALVSALGTLLLIVAGLFSLRWLHGLP
jgi:Ca-activated chloride channel homolog